MPPGYMGRILWVNLTDNTIEDELLDESICRKFIGGYGIGAKLLLDHQQALIDPLSPGSVFGVLTGPFNGTPVFSGARYTVVGKSPLTGCWGDANSGGYFGSGLKFAGYDGVLFKGIAQKPVYLFINEGRAEIKDAGHIWGKDTYETEDILRSELGKHTRVACIGPAGEKISLISSIMHDRGRAAGRSGLGAVMGSKRLKAIAVKGSMNVPVADAMKVKELSAHFRNNLAGPIEFFRDIGTPAFTVPHCQEGDSPVKNWGGIASIDFPQVELLGSDAVKRRVDKRYACYGCPIACGGLIKKSSGQYQYESGSHRPEYETLAMFGSNCLNSDLESIIKVNDLCNRYGIDTISAGATIAFTMESYENGLIDQSDTDGIKMTWGNHSAIVAMTEKLAERDGFGDILADGVKKAAERIGKGAEKYAIHIQGQELPAHDPKYASELATTYKLDATPARHTQGSEERHPPGLIPRYNRKSYSDRALIHKNGVSMNHIMNCTGMCSFLYGTLPSIDAIVEYLNAVTGWDTTLNELLITGERIANVRHMFNLREGMNSILFSVPDRVIGKPPKIAGPTRGITIDEDTLYSEYLAVMGWDMQTAIPAIEKLMELGLEDLSV